MTYSPSDEWRIQSSNLRVLGKPRKLTGPAAHPYTETTSNAHRFNEGLATCVNLRRAFTAVNRLLNENHKTILSASGEPVGIRKRTDVRNARGGEDDQPQSLDLVRCSEQRSKQPYYAYRCGSLGTRNRNTPTHCHGF